MGSAIKPGILAFIRGCVRDVDNNNLLVTVIRKSLVQRDATNEGNVCRDSLNCWLVKTEGRALKISIQNFINNELIGFEYCQEWFIPERLLLPIDADGTHDETHEWVGKPKEVEKKREHSEH
jgi:hypothetical protein